MYLPNLRLFFSYLHHFDSCLYMSYRLYEVTPCYVCRTCSMRVCVCMCIMVTFSTVSSISYVHISCSQCPLLYIQLHTTSLCPSTGSNIILYLGMKERSSGCLVPISMAIRGRMSYYGHLMITRDPGGCIDPTLRGEMVLGHSKPPHEPILLLYYIIKFITASMVK